jgi:pimeloyl-ACP methyl ester carboxylesterase
LPTAKATAILSERPRGDKWQNRVMERTRVRQRKKRARAAAATALLLVSASAAAQSPTGLQERVIFGEYSPLASEAQVVRRLLGPLAAGQIERTLQESPRQLRAVDRSGCGRIHRLRAARGARAWLRAPSVHPALAGCAPAGRLGRGARPLRVVFVSARQSGNDANVLGRRAPLALLGAHNIMSRYPVDAQKVYVGGFSGGARVALRLALAYPDLFHGALLNAGSDPVDAGPPSPPSAERLQQFQQSSRLVYVKGENDLAHLAMDAASLRSLREWCVFDAEAQVTPKAAHAVADAAAFGGALYALLNRSPPAAGKLTACRAAIAERVAGQLKEVAALIASDRRADAQKLLSEIDRHFGGVAAPRSLELESALGWRFPAR